MTQNQPDVSSNAVLFPDLVLSLSEIPMVCTRYCADTVFCFVVTPTSLRAEIPEGIKTEKIDERSEQIKTLAEGEIFE